MFHSVLIFPLHRNYYVCNGTKGWDPHNWTLIFNSMASCVMHIIFANYPDNRN